MPQIANHITFFTYTKEADINCKQTFSTYFGLALNFSIGYRKKILYNIR